MKCSDRDRVCVNTIRFLSVDMVEKASSGHPGMPLGAAPMAYVLWTRFPRHNPKNPHFWDRDRLTARLAVEAASPLGWKRWTGLEGAVIGVDRFGASATGATLFEEYGFTVDHVVAQALALAGRGHAPRA